MTTHQPPAGGADFYVGGRRVATNVPATFLPHVVAEHTEMDAATAARAIELQNLAGAVMACAQFATNDVADIANGRLDLERLREHYREEHADNHRDPDDGETTLDVWLECSPEGQRDLLLSAAWGARDTELPDTDELTDYDPTPAVVLQQYAREYTPAVEALAGGFLPNMPGGPLSHPAALFAIGYASDSTEDPVDVLTTYLVLVLATLRASRAERTG